jgi:thioredoxin-like negative regulator of GroEL
MLSCNAEIFPEIIGSGQPVVAMITAPWCGPCKVLKPILLKLEEVYKDKVKFISINSDDEYELCGSFKVSAIPTILFIVNSIEKSRVLGVGSENKIIENIEGIILK